MNKSKLDAHYALSKLEDAVQVLATHSGTIRQRLLPAFYSFGSLTENYFPPELRSQWTRINGELTKFGPTNELGSVEHTLSRIRAPTATKIATLIVELKNDLSNAV